MATVLVEVKRVYPARPGDEYVGEDVPGMPVDSDGLVQTVFATSQGQRFKVESERAENLQESGAVTILSESESEVERAVDSSRETATSDEQDLEHLGGGWYDHPSFDERIRGKDNALQALEE